jgi:DNA-binding CsgD family transcriptional regulator
MPGLSQRDRAQLFDIAVAVVESAEPAAQDLILRESLGPLFHATVVWELEIDYKAATGRTLRAWPDWATEIIPVGGWPESLTESHPYYHYYSRADQFVPARVSDLASPRSWQESEAYAVTRELGISHSIALPVRRRFGCLVLMRSDVDFSERDLSVARQLQPFLVAADRQNVQNERWRDDVRRNVLPDAVAIVSDLGISPRELAVLGAMAEGLSIIRIARRLQISERTVGKHQERLYRKLGTDNRVGAVLRAQQIGLVPVAPLATHERAGCLPAQVGGTH